MPKSHVFYYEKESNDRYLVLVDDGDHWLYYDGDSLQIAKQPNDSSICIDVEDEFISLKDSRPDGDRLLVNGEPLRYRKIRHLQDRSTIVWPGYGELLYRLEETVHCSVPVESIDETLTQSQETNCIGDDDIGVDFEGSATMPREPSGGSFPQLQTQPDQYSREDSLYGDTQPLDRTPRKESAGRKESPPHKSPCMLKSPPQKEQVFHYTESPVTSPKRGDESQSTSQKLADIEKTLLASVDNRVEDTKVDSDAETEVSDEVQEEVQGPESMENSVMNHSLESTSGDQFMERNQSIVPSKNGVHDTSLSNNERGVSEKSLDPSSTLDPEPPTDTLPLPSEENVENEGTTMNHSSRGSEEELPHEKNRAAEPPNTQGESAVLSTALGASEKFSGCMITKGEVSVETQMESSINDVKEPHSGGEERGPGPTSASSTSAPAAGQICTTSLSVRGDGTRACASTIILAPQDEDGAPDSEPRDTARENEDPALNRLSRVFDDSSSMVQTQARVCHAKTLDSSSPSGSTVAPDTPVNKVASLPECSNASIGTQKDAAETKRRTPLTRKRSAPVSDLRSSNRSARKAKAPKFSGEDIIRIASTGVKLSTQHKRIIKKLGGELIENLDSIYRANYLIAGDDATSIRRTPKVLIAMNCGIPLLHLDWLVSCGTTGKFVSPTKKHMLLNDKKAEEEFDFCMKDSMERWVFRDKRGEKLLTGWFVYVCKNLFSDTKVPDSNTFELIISSAGGVFCDRFTKDECDRTLVITRTENYKLPRDIKSAVQEGAQVRTYHWLFNAMLRQEHDL